MTIHLDTSFLIGALDPDLPQHSRLREWLDQGAEIQISAVAWAEFWCGPTTPDERSAARHLLPEPIPLTGPDAEVAARLFNISGRRRRTLEDCLIAAVAMGSNAAVATSDYADFRRFEIEGLTVLTA